jgi:hypothetical protein
MEVIRKVTQKTQVAIKEPVKPNESRLVLGINDDEYIEVNNSVRIYLNYIKRNGGNCRTVSLIFIGDRNIPIGRKRRIK